MLGDPQTHGSCCIHMIQALGTQSPTGTPSGSSLCSTQGKAASVQSFIHSVVLFSVSVFSPPATKSEVSGGFSCHFRTLDPLLEASPSRSSWVLGSPGWSIMGRWEGSSTDSGVQQESSCPAHLGFLGRTTQPGILSQPLFLYFLLTADNEPGMESSAKRKDALPHGVSPTH